MSTSTLYIDQPCDRCGGKKKIAKTWNETIINIAGKSTIQVSQIVCTNKECQALFEANRVEELKRIDERKSKKDEQDKARRDNIAKTVATRQKNKAIKPI